MPDKSAKWDLIIRPPKGFARLNLGEALTYVDLIALLVKRNFKLLYAQTALGPIWVALQPLITTLVFTVIFGSIAKLPTDGAPNFLFYMAGNIAWQYFQQCLTATSQTFIMNRNLFSKVYFPRVIMPMSMVLTQLINFLVQFALFIACLGYYIFVRQNVAPNYALMAYTPLILLQLALLGLGFGIIVSALTTRYRDLQLLVTFGAHLWMYATPVAYSTSMIAKNYPSLMKYYMLNPLTPMIELFRAAYLGAPIEAMNYYWLSWITTLLVLFIGLMLFTKVEKTFMDTV